MNRTQSPPDLPTITDDRLDEILAQARIEAIDRGELSADGYGWDRIAARAVWAAAMEHGTEQRGG